MNYLPFFEEEDIPADYGIEHSHDGYFYPYHIDAEDTTQINHLTDEQGLDLRCTSRDEAIKAIHSESVAGDGCFCGASHDCTTKTPITDFIITHGILFSCPQCSKPIKADHHGPYHVSTGDHCPGCGIFYSVEWKTPIESSIVESVAIRREKEKP